INDKRIARFHQKITDTLAAGELQLYQELIERYQQAQNVPALEIAAALAKLAQGSTPLLLKPQPEPPVRFNGPKTRGDYVTSPASHPASPAGPARAFLHGRPRHAADHREEGMETFRLEVGLAHNVKPGNIVGAIANEAGIEGRHIGRIRLYEDYSTVDLPTGMPADIFNGLKKTRVAGRPLNITRVADAGTEGTAVVKHRSVENPPGTGKRRAKDKKKKKQKS
ncbi:MAG TPA: DbpA RNA binding domain-containing protein, partial [Gammaproteobacteria bacterium]|nr:DbpA RNA binding domain-containing protein [Gammaproteobacteria bacterium]